jgi:hypothetical protein
MATRIFVANAEQADTVWRLLCLADDGLLPCELWIGDTLQWVASRSAAGLLTTLLLDHPAHSRLAIDRAAT